MDKEKVRLEAAKQAGKIAGKAVSFQIKKALEEAKKERDEGK
jgi:hypothetical protein